MRKLTASILATTALAGAAFTGSALAAGPPSHSSHGSASVDRSASKRDRPELRSRHESTSLDRTSRDRSAHERQQASTGDR